MRMTQKILQWSGSSFFSIAADRKVIVLVAICYRGLATEGIIREIKRQEGCLEVRASGSFGHIALLERCDDVSRMFALART